MFKATPIHEQIDHLLSRTRDELSMYEHWLKAKFLEGRKTMDDEAAWKSAKAYAKRMQKRRKWELPRFTSEERRNIEKWQPRSRIRMGSL